MSELPSFDDYDEVIHAPRRLSICAFLASVDAAEFATLRDSLGISESSLSKQIRILVIADYVRTERVTARGRARMWLRLTSAGRDAFDAHIARLRHLVQTYGLGPNPE